MPCYLIKMLFFSNFTNNRFTALASSHYQLKYKGYYFDTSNKTLRILSDHLATSSVTTAQHLSQVILDPMLTTEGVTVRKDKMVIV